MERLHRREDGFTIIESLIGMMLVVIGAFAVLAVVEKGLVATNTTLAREQAVNLARELVERAHQVPYATLTVGGAPGALAGTLAEAPSASNGSFTVTRRNTTYTVSVIACSLDDPSDGAAPVYDAETAQFCDAPAPNTAPGSTMKQPPLAVGVKVMGLAVSGLGGYTLLDQVCAILASHEHIAHQVSSVTGEIEKKAGGKAELVICPATVRQAAIDVDPDDMRRVQVAVSWDRGDGAHTVTQSTVLPAPR